MRVCARLALVSLVVTAGFGLAACDSIDRMSDTMYGLFDTKRRLPGERKPVFPEGVPGVTQGVPPEYLPASKQPEEETNEPAVQQRESSAERKTADTPPEKKAQPARKPRPRTADVPKKQVESAKPAKAAPAKPAPAKPAQSQAPWPQQQQTQSQAPWPQQQQTRSQAAWPQPAQNQNSPTAPWPAAPPPGTFSR
jgi:hypothetical protein